MKDWVGLATRRDVVILGLKVAGIVGTILVAINQGDLLLSGDMSATLVWKIALTYSVPYCVSTYAATSALLAQQNQQEGE